MSKVSNQPSGVVAGTLDISSSTEPDAASPTDAGAVLSRRVTKAGNARQKR